MNRLMRSFKRDIPLHVMLLPAIVLLVIYRYIPMLGISLAFIHYVPSIDFFKSPFVGFDNFIALFTTQGFGQAIFNTVYIALMKILTGLAVPVIFALLLNEVRIKFVKKTVQTIIYLPYFVSWVLMAGIIINILSPVDGIMNQLLGVFGIKPIFFLGDNNWFPYVLVATNVWKDFGWGTVIYMAALTGISETLYEAAVIDGAGRWKQTIHITLPGISSTVVLLATLSLGNVLDAGFDQVFNLLSPITLKSGDIIDTLVYRLAFHNGQFSISTASSLFRSIISCILIVTSYKLAYRYAGYRIF